MLQLIPLLRPPSAMAGGDDGASGGGEVSYPLDAGSYRLLCKIGSGVSAVVLLGKLAFGSITLVRPRRPPSVCVRLRSRGEAFAVRARMKR
jgi:hypothetical protein